MILSKELIWLPRQDQLQEMARLCVGGSNIYGRLRQITEFQMKTPHQTMEQLWLAFVMKEKFNKTWNGSEWIS